MTTLEYIRMERYKKYLFDTGYKNNFDKFKEEDYDFEKNLVYNDASKEAFKRIFLVKDYFEKINLFRKNEKNLIKNKKEMDDFDFNNTKKSINCSIIEDQYITK